MTASREAVFEKVLRRLPLPDRAAFRQEYGAAWRDEDGRASAEPERLREAADAVIAHWAGEHINSERTCSMQDDIDNLAALVGRPRAWPAVTPPPAGNEEREE